MHPESRANSRLHIATGRLVDVLLRRVEVSKVTYLGVATGVSLGTSLLVAVLYWLVATQLLGLSLPTGYVEPALPFAVELLAIVAAAPVVETFILALAVGLARVFGYGEGAQVLAGALPLGLLHAVNGITAIDAGGHAVVSVVSFLVFALVYVVWRRESFRAAFWMCAAVHAVHNAVMFAAMIADGRFSG
jgi:hypothetical protein